MILADPSGEFVELSREVLPTVQNANDRHNGVINLIKDDMLFHPMGAKTGAQLVSSAADDGGGAKRRQRSLKSGTVGLHLPLTPRLLGVQQECS